jgi:NDP-sugar pyrophosphorylase family protein
MDSELVEVEEGLRWTVKHFVEKKRFENLEEVLLWNTLIFVMNREVLYFQWKHKNDIKITSLLILPSQNNFSLVLSVFEFLKWFCLVNYMLSRKIIWFYMSTRDFNNLYLKYLSYFIYFIC